MSRLFLPALSIEVVAVRRTAPNSFTWERRLHPIERIEEYWLADIGWWRPDDHISRDYYLLTTKTGLLVEIFRSRLTSGWYLQRLYD